MVAVMTRPISRQVSRKVFSQFERLVDQRSGPDSSVFRNRLAKTKTTLQIGEVFQCLTHCKIVLLLRIFVYKVRELLNHVLKIIINDVGGTANDCLGK